MFTKLQQNFDNRFNAFIDSRVHATIKQQKSRYSTHVPRGLFENIVTNIKNDISHESYKAKLAYNFRAQIYNYVTAGAIAFGILTITFLALSILHPGFMVLALPYFIATTSLGILSELINNNMKKTFTANAIEVAEAVEFVKRSFIFKPYILA
jgi:hypothetical protein